MSHLSRKEFRTYRPRYLRSGIGEGRDASGNYPTPAELFSAIGAILLIALCVGLAADLLADALGH
jgi:hypothetical protein